MGRNTHHHLLLGLLVLLAGCAATQPTYAPPPAPTPAPVSYYLPIDQDWVVLTKQVDVRRKGQWNAYGNNRHYWARFWNYQDGKYVLQETIANCANRTTMRLAYSVYEIKTDKHVQSWSLPRREMDPMFFEPVIPDSIGETAFDFVCQPPEVR